jgi:hypothetical protein
MGGIKGFLGLVSGSSGRAPACKREALSSNPTTIKKVKIKIKINK